MKIPAIIFLFCGIIDIFLAGIDLAIGDTFFSVMMLALGIWMLHVWANKREEERVKANEG